MESDPQDAKLLLAYLGSELGPNEAARLECRLKEDDALRRQFLEFSIEEAALADWAKAERAVISLEDKAFEDVTIPSASGESGAGAKALPRSPWLAAVAAVLAISLAALVVSRWFEGDTDAREVARIVASVDAKWGGSAGDPDMRLPLGKYELAQGSVDLEFADGAKVSLGGPAAFTIKGSNHIHIESGNLVARIPDEALGFIVTSPQSEVIDLGTEFGISVSEAGRTDVHVLDGLVEVFPVSKSVSSPGVMVSAGEARSFGTDPEGVPAEIPVSTRDDLLGKEQFSRLGLEMLRGSVRVSEGLSAGDFTKKAVGPNWIDLIAEEQGVMLSQPLEVTIDSPGSYRDFENISRSLSPGKRLKSYLLHFRPGTREQVRGVIRFDEPVMAVLCTGRHLGESDALFGVSTVDYPRGGNPFRGLEPNGRPTAGNARETDPDWQPDEIVLSQDRRTLSIRAFANTERGYDQIRVLTMAPGQN